MVNWLIQSLCIAAFSCLTSGCFTYASHESFKESRKTKQFYPIALYKGSDGGLVIEGSWKDERKELDQSDHLFLLVPSSVVQKAHLEKAGEVSFLDISKLPAATLNQLKIRKTLPTGYERAADWSGHAGFAGRSRSVMLGFVGLLPLTLALDAATSPIQALMLHAYSENPIE